MANENFEAMTIEELEQVRAEAQAIIAAQKERFMAAGRVLNQKLQLAEVVNKADRLREVADQAEAEAAKLRGKI